jgi:hypothetical protein
MGLAEIGNASSAVDAGVSTALRHAPAELVKCPATLNKLALAWRRETIRNVVGSFGGTRSKRMLIAARSSHDLACWWRATVSARSKYASAFVVSRSGDLSAISPATRLISASNHLSSVVSTAVTASLIQRLASSNRLRSA